MNLKLIDLNNKLRELQTRKQEIKKDLVALNNDIASKKEFLATNENKYKNMEEEMEAMKTEIKKVQAMDPNESEANTYQARTEKYLELQNLKKEFAEFLRNENLKFDRKFMADDKLAKSNNLRPEDEFYYKSMKEVIMVKYSKKKVREEDQRVTSKGDEEEIQLNPFHNINYFRINKDTMFDDLKMMVCTFWNVNPDCHELRNEDGVELPKNEKVESYFSSFGQEAQHTMIVLKPMEKSVKMTPGLMNAIKLGDQTNGKLEEVAFSRTKKIEIDPYKEFFKEFPGKKDYIDHCKLMEKEKPKTPKKKQEKKTRFINSDHCCVAFWVLLLLVITGSTLNAYEDPSGDFTTTASFQCLFKVDSTLFTFDQPYQSINDIESFYTYLETVIVLNMFFEHLDQPITLIESMFLRQNVFIGPLRLRQVRSQPRTNCLLVNMEYQNVSCYSQDYNEDTRQTSDLGDGTKPWQKFHTAEENGITSTIKGTFSDYDGSGYVVDFDSSLTQAQALDIITQLRETKFIDSQTRAVFLTILINNLATMDFIQVNLGIEISVSGYLKPLDFQIISFYPNKYSSMSTGAAADVVKTILAILLLLSVLYQTATNEEGRPSLNWRYLITFTALTDIALITCSFAALACNVKASSSGYTSEQILSQRTQFFDMEDIAKGYNDSVGYDAYIIFFATIRLIYFLKLTSPFFLVCKTLENAAYIIIRYTISFVTIMIALAIVGMIFWGAFSPDWSGFISAFFAVNTLFIGRFDTQILEVGHQSLVAVYLSFYYFFIMFFILSLYVSVAIEAYRKIIVEHGDGRKEAPINGVGGLIKWLFSWLPGNFIEKKFQRRPRMERKVNAPVKPKRASIVEMNETPEDKYKV